VFVLGSSGKKRYMYRNFFYKEENDLRTIFRYIRILEDDSYYKVVIYGVSTKDFNIKGGLLLIRNKLEIFNNGLRLTTDPI
jgi:hypothetical protein